MTDYLQEIGQGNRFAFGKNWLRFLRAVNENRIHDAETSLRGLLDCERLDGLHFLDVGSGSGLFSLAARNLGAKVRSFDYDAESVAATQAMRRRFADDNPDWIIEQGSALDSTYLGQLGQYDIVYSWGVLHHTGVMWQALENVVPLVKPGGRLVVAIYNDQGWRSSLWRMVKRAYCSGRIGRWLVVASLVPTFIAINLFKDLCRLKNPLGRYAAYDSGRGMSLIHDWIDWFGGYPYEVATPEAMVEFYHDRGFQADKVIRRQTLGCNEFVFRRSG